MYRAGALLAKQLKKSIQRSRSELQYKDTRTQRRPRQHRKSQRFFLKLGTSIAEGCLGSRLQLRSLRGILWEDLELRRCRRVKGLRLFAVLRVFALNSCFRSRTSESSPEFDSHPRRQLYSSAVTSRREIAMSWSRVLLSAALFSSFSAHAALVDKPLSFTVDDKEFAGVLIYDEANAAARSLLLVPNWLGINEANLEQARLVAGRGYNVYVVDMYGANDRPKTMQEAGAAAGAVKKDAVAMRLRINTALTTLLEQTDVKVNPKLVGAIGFCFGGTVALELARSGAAVPGVVSFHGGLATGKAADSASLLSKVLVLHGADDPNVPPPEVHAFESEMRSAKADWQLVSFGGAVHSFTDVDANTDGRSKYHPVVAKRAYEMMDDFFTEVLVAP